MRQARYRDRTKTLFQSLMAAAVANLALVAGKSDLMGPQRTAQRWMTALTKTLQDRLRPLLRPQRRHVKPIPDAVQH